MGFRTNFITYIHKIYFTDMQEDFMMTDCCHVKFIMITRVVGKYPFSDVLPHIHIHKDIVMRYGLLTNMLRSQFRFGLKILPIKCIVIKWHIRFCDRFKREDVLFLLPTEQK